MENYFPERIVEWLIKIYLKEPHHQDSCTVSVHRNKHMTSNLNSIAGMGSHKVIIYERYVTSATPSLVFSENNFPFLKQEE